MIREDSYYCSFELSKRLKNLGFSKITKCDKAYWTTDDGVKIVNYSDKYTDKSIRRDGFICWAPSIMLVIEWLYTRQGILVSYSKNGMGYFRPEIEAESEKRLGFKKAISNDEFPTPTYALAEGIMMAVGKLEKLKELYESELNTFDLETWF